MRRLPSRRRSTATVEFGRSGGPRSSDGLLLALSFPSGQRPPPARFCPPQQARFLTFVLVPQPVLTASTYGVAWPQGDQLLGRDLWHTAMAPNPMADELPRGAASTTMWDVAPTFIQSRRAAKGSNLRTACLSSCCRGVDAAPMPPLAHRSHVVLCPTTVPFDGRTSLSFSSCRRHRRCHRQ